MLSFLTLFQQKLRIHQYCTFPKILSKERLRIFSGFLCFILGEHGAKYRIGLLNQSICYKRCQLQGNMLTIHHDQEQKLVPLQVERELLKFHKSALVQQTCQHQYGTVSILRIESLHIINHAAFLQQQTERAYGDCYESNSLGLLHYHRSKW